MEELAGALRRVLEREELPSGRYIAWLAPPSDMFKR
jgi:hypothetical protein